MVRNSRKTKAAATVLPSGQAQQQDGLVNVPKQTRQATRKGVKSPATTLSDVINCASDVDLTASQSTQLQEATDQAAATEEPAPEEPRGSGNDGKDKQIIELMAEIHKLRSMNKALVTSSENSKAGKIDRPARGTAGQDWNLREMMRLQDNKTLYLSIRRTVRDLVIRSPMDLNVPWKNQDAQIIADIMALAKEQQPYLTRFHRNWATHEMIRLILKNRRVYQQERQREGKANDEDSNGDEH